MSEVGRNIALGVISSGTYAITDLHNRQILRDSLTFGALNALSQQFIPYFIADKDTQSLFIDPLVASIFQGIVKMFIYEDFKFEERIMLRSIVAGVSAAALVEKII